MSTSRRLPLSNNHNAANSPLRGSASMAKRARSHAEIQREEMYAQPPPAKRQMVEFGVQRAMGSPTKSRIPTTSKSIPPRTTSRAAATTTAQRKHLAATYVGEPELEQWKTQIRGRFPNMVFYFESIPDDLRARLTKQVTHFGAREEKFFSINITHIVTGRPIPTEKTVQDDKSGQGDTHETNEHPKTIDPSLLNRLDSKKRLLLDVASNKRMPAQATEDPSRRPKRSNADILHRARDMGKKIWSLEKLQNILAQLDPAAYQNAQRGSAQASANNKHAKHPDLLKLLENERVHGPSDRDPTVMARELQYFKGPYIYVYDIEEKTKPIMVREYPKVQSKGAGDWPQFRSVTQGRCPFVMDYEPKEERAPAQPKERIVKAAVQATAPALKPPQVPTAKPVTGKRSLAEMEEGQGPVTRNLRHATLDAVKISNPPVLDFGNHQNAFISRAGPGRFLAGEPVASGVQRSKATSAIQSQVVSSASGIMGVKAGTSKEIQGLQRKVLQKASTPAVSQDPSSRRLASMSLDSNTFIQSTGVASGPQRRLELIDENEVQPQQQQRHTAQSQPQASLRDTREKVRRAMSQPAAKAKAKPKDPKPGYCENCQDKFEDFDEHILSRKHRKFAENNDNWRELDMLLHKLKRAPRRSITLRDDEEEDEIL